MAKFFLITCFFLLTVPSWAQWAPLPQHTGYNANIISFGSATHGWLLAEPNLTQPQPAILFNSTDGGNSWQNTTAPFGTYPHALSVHALLNNIAHVFIRQSGTSFGLATKLFRTTDAGISWTDITPDSSDLGMGNGAVYFSDPQNGFVGIGATLTRTTDGGQTWTNATGDPNITVAPNRITGKGSRIAVAAWDATFGYEGIFMLSTDGGTSWDTIPCNRYNTVLQTAVYPAPDTIYGVTGTYSFGAAPEFYRSFDGGTTWDTLFLQFALDSATSPIDLHFENGLNGALVLQNGQILETSDAGLTWTEIFHAHAEISTASFWGGNGWIAGQNGYLASVSGANSLFPAQLARESLKLWPNPTNGRFTVEWPQGWHSPSLSIFDVNGRLIWQNQGLETNEITVNGLESGIYWIQASQGNDLRTQKLIIQ